MDIQSLPFNYRVIGGAIALVVIVVLLLFLFLWRGTEEPTPSVITTHVNVGHQFKDGVHTYTGSVEAPTPCYAVAGAAVVKESYPEQVDIKLEMRDTGGVCAQVITAKTFKVSFEASERPVVRGFINGTPVLLVVSETRAQ